MYLSKFSIAALWVVTAVSWPLQGTDKGEGRRLSGISDVGSGLEVPELHPAEGALTLHYSPCAEGEFVSGGTKLKASPKSSLTQGSGGQLVAQQRLVCETVGGQHKALRPRELPPPEDSPNNSANGEENGGNSARGQAKKRTNASESARKVHEQRSDKEKAEIAKKKSQTWSQKSKQEKAVIAEKKRLAWDGRSVEEKKITTDKLRRAYKNRDPEKEAKRVERFLEKLNSKPQTQREASVEKMRKSAKESWKRRSRQQREAMSRKLRSAHAARSSEAEKERRAKIRNTWEQKPAEEKADIIEKRRKSRKENARRKAENDRISQDMKDAPKGSQTKSRSKLDKSDGLSKAGDKKTPAEKAAILKKAREGDSEKSPEEGSEEVESGQKPASDPDQEASSLWKPSSNIKGEPKQEIRVSKPSQNGAGIPAGRLLPDIENDARDAIRSHPGATDRGQSTTGEEDETLGRGGETTAQNIPSRHGREGERRDGIVQDSSRDSGTLPAFARNDQFNGEETSRLPSPVGNYVWTKDVPALLGLGSLTNLAGRLVQKVGGGLISSAEPSFF